MKKLYNPLFTLLAVTLPQLVLIGLFGRLFWFLHTELTKRQVAYWARFGGVLAAACLGLGIYSAWCFFKKKEVHIVSAYLIFVVYFCFLTAVLFMYDQIIPRSIPNYMFMGMRPANSILTLIMPALGLAAIMISEDIIERCQINSPAKPFLLMIGVPILWFFLIHFARIFYWNRLLGSAVLIMFIVGVAAFLFLFIMIVSMVLKQKILIWQQYMGVLVLAGSLLGLIMNQSLGNIFGDFSHPGFYLCNLVVGGVIMMPEINHPKWRLAVFGIKGILIWYSVYFFIVFLPYMPLVLPGLLALGLGVLLLVPMVLLFMHVSSLKGDYKYLRAFYEKKHLIGLLMIQLTIIPIIIGLTLQGERINLEQALSYTYQRDLKEETSIRINTAGVKRVLGTIERMNLNGTRGLDFISDQNSTPYLTSLYHTYVLNNLTLAPDKISSLKSIFLGIAEERVISSGVTRGDTISVNEINSETIFDNNEKIYRSWIHLELENEDEWLSEFYTTFHLPEGTYISNYYLYVEGEKKYGMLADKRAANWIYEQNKIRNRDPGVLTYLSGGEVEFKIFPFQGREIRKTGIELIHIRPIELTIGSSTLSLQQENVPKSEEKQNFLESYPQINYITKEMKQTLQSVIRKPQYYFILDYSKGRKQNKEAYNKRVESFIKQQNIADDVQEIVAVNYQEKIVEYEKGWENHIQKLKAEGGFYPDYTIRRILYRHYAEKSDKQPIFILVTDEIEKAVFSKDFAEFNVISPEGMRYYQLDSEHRLIAYDRGEQVPYKIRREAGKEVAKIIQEPVLIWHEQDGSTIYIPDDREDSIILMETDIREENLSGGRWERGVLLKAMYISYLLHPERYAEKSLQLIKDSMKSHMMSPLTSFIVLENEAQEKVMLEKQKQLLESQKPFDAEEITSMTQMSEPSLSVVVFLILVFWLKKKRISRESC